MSLYISRTFRQSLWQDESSGLPAGKVVVGDSLTAREVGGQLALNEAISEGDKRGPTAGEIGALALLDDAYQRILDDYSRRRDATLMDRVLAILRAQMGLELVDRLLVEFAEEFLGARMAGLSLLVESQEGVGGEDLGRSQILQQVLVFWLLHSNPAAQPLVSRLHASPLLQVPAFRSVVDLMTAILEREPGYELGDASLWELLIRPQRLSPDSLSGQLSHLREIWFDSLEVLVGRMDAFQGMLAEEQSPRFPPGPGPSELPRYHESAAEIRFSDDQSWMSSLVMVAKHTLVWLDQLSAVYDRPVERLDQIPNAELQRLAALGFNGLWLIGLWERSPASAEIKERTGNREAAASAYSLTRYGVAEELGGERALDNLRSRATRFGIRLAADMVPNHTGLDSDWVAENPEWFISQTECPFPSYRFAGQDLSARPEMGIYLEDHYYDRSDAAVVFKRVDRRSGEVRYVYHGNDGTSMPWNDTAQLDYLNPEVWPAVIDTIVAVARKFPIIRFDAAMTLTRKHFQRLWYPSPGSAGDIPSRAEHGLSEDDFLEAMPREFWRQVVDRVTEEVPDTLLLAEAFWLMEGFFVRTLGMHRVYNSAFMNMLRDGETEKYRQLIKETLVFDPGILKRYVNFMSNPDELSAIEQFGDGDRYFGTCVLMSTLPGLPMFGHGQVEGFRERYGMEFRRAYSDENPREDLVERHLHQIAPILHRRDTFADIEHFRLFDFVDVNGGVHDHVLAFCNGGGDQSTIVVFNNSDHSARGRLKVSVPFRPGSDPPDEKPRTEEIGSILGVGEADHYTVRDAISGDQYLFRSGELIAAGLELDLAGWECRVLGDFRPVALGAEVAEKLMQRLGTGGTPSLAQEQRELELEPLRRALSAALEEDLLRRLMKLPGGLTRLGETDSLLDEMRFSVGKLAQSAGLDHAKSAERLLALMTLPELAAGLARSETKDHRRAGVGLQGALDRRPEVLPLLYCWVLLTVLQEAAGEGRAVGEPPDWRLESSVLPGLLAAGGEPETAKRLLSILRQALRIGWGENASHAPEAWQLQQQLLTDEAMRRTLGVNQFEGREYLSQEDLESFVDMRLLLEAQAWSAGSEATGEVPAAVSAWWQVLERLAADAEASAYRTDQLGIAESVVVAVTEE